jgi:serine phosphatase RsbU (regulator of sigma subunit)
MRLRVEPPNGQAFEHECGGAALVIGRAPTVDLTVDDTWMSRQHARLFPGEDGWFVEDLGARNRTTVNGSPVEGATRLRPGDVMQLGHTIVRVEAPPHDLPAPAADRTTLFRPAAALAELALDAPTGDAVDARSLERLADRLGLLNEFHRSLGTPISLAALLDLLLARLFAVLRPEEGVVLLTRAHGRVETAASRRLPGATGELQVPRRLVDEVVGKGSAALVSDVSLDDRFSGSHSMIRSGIRSILAAPMADAEGCVGMIALYSRAHVRQFSEDDLALLVTLASAAALRIRNIELAEHAAQRRMLERELALAHDIQMAMLPRVLPDRDEVDLAAALRPARAVGGDLYDFFLDGARLWFIVGDVSGKGVGAALVMAVAKTLFRALARGQASVGVVLTRMNQELVRDNEGQVFVTAFAGSLQLDDGSLAVCGAGHNLPFRIARDGLVRTLGPEHNGIALGILEDAVYEETRLSLQAGEGLVIYTDGITDAVNADAELFSTERLEQCLADCGGGPAAQIVTSVFDAVGRFAGDARQEDDMTLLALRYRGRAGAPDSVGRMPGS